MLNRLKERQRIVNGKPAKLHDTSMDARFRMADGVQNLAESSPSAKLDSEITKGTLGVVHPGYSAFKDLTDKENDE
ncbi:hypothetical protein AAF712_016883, partial [Marasmius tenuissimus]